MREQTITKTNGGGGGGGTVSLPYLVYGAYQHLSPPPFPIPFPPYDQPPIPFTPPAEPTPPPPHWQRERKTDRHAGPNRNRLPELGVLRCQPAPGHRAGRRHWDSVGRGAGHFELVLSAEAAARRAREEAEEEARLCYHMMVLRVRCRVVWVIWALGFGGWGIQVRTWKGRDLEINAGISIY